MTNPLLSPSSLPHEAVPFDRLATEHFLPALTAAILEAKENLAKIRDGREPPTFTNTIVALEAAAAKVYDVAYVYSNLRSANGDQEMQALAKAIMPRLIDLESDINLDAELFARVKSVYDQEQGQSTSLSPEGHTLLEQTYRSFCRNGGRLDAAGKGRLRALDEELSTLGPQFSEHVLKATNDFVMVLGGEDELAGLPASAREAALADAKARGLQEGWAFTLQAPSLTAFLRYAERRDLRERIWRASVTRATSGGASNAALVGRIAQLRHQRARLLGFESHAHFQMEERMAEHPDRVRRFLADLLAKSRPAAENEMAELREYMGVKGATHELMPWDYAYWANRLKEERFGVKAEELRPYFPLEQVLAGAYELAERLFDLRFKEVHHLPVYAEGVRVFEATRGDEFMGLFYTDFFPRATKAGGAWCTRFKSQWQEGGVNHRPHVAIVCNFSPPTAAAPSLLTFAEAETLFHEFGHGLHSLLSQCVHRSLSCTSVYRDFVELPSQIMENFLKEETVLAFTARHYQTNAAIPRDLVERLTAAENFHAAYFMMRQLRFCYLDLAWYGGDPGAAVDVWKFEAEATKPTELLPTVPGANLSCAFEHIFSGGYSAGYYGYKWAEVLDADAFELFKEQGILNRQVAEAFRRQVLERGGSEHPMVLYRRFRGREPDPMALLRRSGLVAQ